MNARESLADWEARTNQVSLYNADGSVRTSPQILEAAKIAVKRHNAGDYRTVRTGDVISDMADLDTLPPGSVVIPLWIGKHGLTDVKAEQGMNACVRFSDGWYQTLLEKRVFPLGAGGTARVIYDPRDEENNAEQN
ncbi:hypothetical protein SEA_KABOCHA_104 [Gordonia phage Kabocha]|uniref:Uncharacterized protein n=1 Tax=Gordonia phage Chidiebere TaxID=2656530 RepID=A0A649VKR1_9CAUD|nr:hypothetical protein PQD14_gp103 [Gordonia phage Chidiebere]AZS07953.1 hypothetical protein PBI_GRAY_102 [Gordonia phage Gray]WAA19890.1 hypothetical protein SEA_KABOCHA_104 [Gordonia phage Kabocha]WAA20079.1 hypothetical protein SEA_HANEM_102 [Gordonia phage Hanem]WNM67122.1 hypothetical protein SEA_SCHOMBER_101 [Gordonia Phage Schomber]QGJ92990.1 hypothetical protein PBI_CHIDIEBERE_103 [Gordonia phage Chidiebere]